MENTFTALLRKYAIHLIIVIALVLLGSGIYLYLKNTSISTSSMNGVGGEVSSATSTVTSGNTENRLPTETVFTLPKGAVPYDDYAFRKGEGVFFKSLTGAEPVQIPNADINSFKRISDFATYETTAVTRDCKGPAQYAYYADSKSVYFYQVWKTPSFRSSRIELIRNAKRSEFQVTGTTATDGLHTYVIDYEVASSTCWLLLSPQ